MDRFRFLLNGQEIEEPIGFDEMEIMVFRDEDKRYIGLRFPLEVKFVGTAYTLIKAEEAANGREARMTFVVEEWVDEGSFYDTLFNGTIRLDTGTDRPHITNEGPHWETMVFDNSFSAYITNAMEQPINCDQVLSKEGTAIAACPSFQLQILLGFTGTHLSTDKVTIKAYDLKEVFSYMIRWLSNGVLSFRSNWYDNLAPTERVCLVPGISMHYRSDAPLITTLLEALNSIGRTDNLYLSVEGSTVVLEDESYFVNSSEVVSLNDPDDLEVYADTTATPGTIKLGDKTAGDTQFFNEVPRSRKFFQPVECATETSLDNPRDVDLQTEYVTSPGLLYYYYLRTSNYISNQGQKYIRDLFAFTQTANDWTAELPAKLLTWFESTYADKIYMSTYDSTTNKEAFSQYLGTTAIANNERFTNENILARYSFGADVFYASDQFDSFRLTIEDETFSAAENDTWEIVTFSNADPAATTAQAVVVDGGQYINSSGYYQAQQDETKTFYFAAMVVSYAGNGDANDNDYYINDLTTTPNTRAGVLGPSNLEVTLALSRYTNNSGLPGTLLARNTSSVFTQPFGMKVLEFSQQIALSNTDIAVAEIKISDGTSGSYEWLYIPVEFKDVATEKKVLAVNSPSGFRNYRYSFTHPVKPKERRDYLAAPYKAVSILGTNGWTDTVMLNPSKNSGNFKLLGTTALT